MTEVNWGSTELIKQYEKEYKQLYWVLQMNPMFSSDESIFYYHGSCSNSGIDIAARKFYISRIYIAFGIDISHLFSMNHYPKLITILEYIRKNRTKDKKGFVELKENKELSYLFDIVSIVNKSVDEKELAYETYLAGLIGIYEQREYQKGYLFYEENVGDLREDMKSDEKYLTDLGEYVVSFADGKTKTFSKREDIYHWLIVISSFYNTKYDIIKEYELQ